MAIVKAPLFSFGATGSIFHTLAYQKRHKKYCCIKKITPKDKKTVNEQKVRIGNQLGKSKWRLLSAVQKFSWESMVHKKPRGGYHEFISQWLNRYLNNKIPYITPNEDLFWPQKLIIASKT